MKDLSERTLSLFSDSTRDKLLKKSLELFNKKGYVSVTTSLLASSSNVREGNLWYHFKSKKNLVESHIELFKENISLEKLNKWNDSNIIIWKPRVANVLSYLQK